MMLVDSDIHCLELCNLTILDVFETTISIQGKEDMQKYILV